MTFKLGGDYWVASVLWMPIGAASSAILGTTHSRVSVFEVVNVSRGDIPRPDSFVESDQVALLTAGVVWE